MVVKCPTGICHTIVHSVVELGGVLQDHDLRPHPRHGGRRREEEEKGEGFRLP